MMRRRMVVLVSILAGLSWLVSGCATPQTDPTVSASPTFRCTTADPLSPGPCSQADWEAQQADEALYQEAVAVYTRFFNENQRIERAGGITEPTPELLATAADPMLAQVMRFYRSQHERRDVISGEMATLRIFRGKMVPRDGGVVSITTCEDIRGIIVTAADGSDLSVPGVLIKHIDLIRVGDSLHAHRYASRREQGCPY